MHAKYREALIKCRLFNLCTFVEKEATAIIYGLVISKKKLF